MVGKNQAKKMQPKAKNQKWKKTQMQNTWAMGIHTMFFPYDWKSMHTWDTHTHTHKLKQILIYYPSNITVTNYIKNIHSKHTGYADIFFYHHRCCCFYISIFTTKKKFYTFIVIIWIFLLEKTRETMIQNHMNQDKAYRNHQMMILDPTKPKKLNKALSLYFTVLLDSFFQFNISFTFKHEEKCREKTNIIVFPKRKKISHVCDIWNFFQFSHLNLSTTNNDQN